MNLFEKETVIKEYAQAIGCDEHKAVARECVRKSMVLLQNNNAVLPLNNKYKNIVVTGKSGHDLGNQCGGWTITWQGESGNGFTKGTTIFEALAEQLTEDCSISYQPDISDCTNIDLAVVVIGEKPYAEMFGDRKSLAFDSEDKAIVKLLHEKGIPVVTVIISGRPIALQEIKEQSDAIIAAWLPGTEGHGIADVLTGKFDFTGKLSVAWPKDPECTNLFKNPEASLFPVGFGLSYNS